MYDDDYNSRYSPRNPLATASFILGGLSLLTCSLFYIALPCGALAVLFGFLSRSTRTFSRKSKVGILTGFSGMILTVFLTIMAMRALLTNPQLRSYVEEYVQIYTGDPSFRIDQFIEDYIPYLPHEMRTDDEELSEETEAIPDSNEEKHHTSGGGAFI